MEELPRRPTGVAGSRFGVSPGGLTHSAYCGHSFWDAETWVLPSLAALFPSLGSNLVAYRTDRLAAAQDAARLQGLACASTSPQRRVALSAQTTALF